MIPVLIAIAVLALVVIVAILVLLARRGRAPAETEDDTVSSADRLAGVHVSPFGDDRAEPPRRTADPASAAPERTTPPTGVPVWAEGNAEKTIDAPQPMVQAQPATSDTAPPGTRDVGPPTAPTPLFDSVPSFVDDVGPPQFVAEPAPAVQAEPAPEPQPLVEAPATPSDAHAPTAPTPLFDSVPSFVDDVGSPQFTADPAPPVPAPLQPETATEPSKLVHISMLPEPIRAALHGEWYLLSPIEPVGTWPAGGHVAGGPGANGPGANGPGANGPGVPTPPSPPPTTAVPFPPRVPVPEPVVSESPGSEPIPFPFGSTESGDASGPARFAGGRSARIRP